MSDERVGLMFEDGTLLEARYNPDGPNGMHWTVVCDLRPAGSEPTDPSNYAAAEAMRAAHPEVIVEAETSCFYAYAPTDAAAEAVVAGLAAWAAGQGRCDDCGGRGYTVESHILGEHVNWCEACAPTDPLIARTAERVGWLERVHGVSFNEQQRRCAAVLCTLDAPYNWAAPGPIPGASLAIHETSMSLLWQGTLSTFDTDGLTRLVFAGHDVCVRVQVDAYVSHIDDDRAERLTDELVDAGHMMSAGEVRCLEIWVHARNSRDGGLYDRHPTLETAVEARRLSHRGGTR